MPEKANRCPHCWAALADDVADFCPFCGRTVATRQKRRGRGETPGPSRRATDAPAGPAPYEPYQPYEPPYRPPEAHRASRPYEPSYRPSGPPEPHQASQPDESGWPAPAHSQPAAAYSSLATAPTGGGVAVAERDPVEFPGRPLPPGFFDALPERVRNPKARRNPGKIITVVVVVAIGGITALRSADRSEDLSSPARPLIASACAEYRDFTTRLDKSDDEAALAKAFLWFRSNVDTFDQAALLDPELAGAADFVAWFDGVIQANFVPLAAMSEAEVDAREEPLTRACYRGIGRA